MKAIKYKMSTGLFFFFSLFLFFSCSEEEILKEVPLDFYSPENSYTTPEHFEAAVTNLYSKMRDAYYSSDYSYNLIGGTDFGRDARNIGSFSIGDYPAKLTSSSGHADFWWRHMYTTISGANAILDRIDDVEYPSQTEKNAIIAEARFFRGFSYRVLAYVYGGVPLVLEEITSPKRDFTRATRAEVYQQSIEDLKYAAEHLPTITNVKAEGRVSKAAALHFLAELYLATEQWDKSINAASEVIDNPNFKLMTERFGNWTNEPGDVWWDLFRRNNQNRSSGNKEAIWVAQIETDESAPGEGRYLGERIYGSLYWQIKDPDGKAGFIGPTAEYGRGAAFLAPTEHWATTIWESDWDNDMRNNEYNMIRDFVYDNPESAYFGEKVSEFPPADLDERMQFYPYQRKTVTIHQPDYMIVDEETGLLSNGAWRTYLDQYYARLAETYLIRAEAYLGQGNKTEAAEDINAVRRRVDATPVAPADVDIDFILDERLRELAYEEKRRLTLSRLGMVYERTKEYNTYADGQTIQPHNELFPIHFSEIERNTGAPLEQNPGY